MTEPRRRRLSDTANHSTGFHRRPSAIVCKCCGGQYFAASLPIHQKTCFDRNPFVDIVCPECRTSVKSGNYHEHVASCDGVTEIVSNRVSKPEARPEDLNSPEPDGRVRCRNCDRAFHVDRIAKHQSVCVGTKRRIYEPIRNTAVHAKSLHEGQIRQRRYPTKTFSTSRHDSPLSRSRHVPAVHVVFTGVSESSSTPARPWNRNREYNRPDPLHRYEVHRLSLGGRSGGGTKPNLSLSTATSASNPLATNRLMTVNSS